MLVRAIGLASRLEKRGGIEMRRLKKSLSALTAMIMVVSSLMVGNFTAHAASEVWTESSYVNVFLDSTKPKGASSSINLVAAKNEFEAAQDICTQFELSIY